MRKARFRVAIFTPKKGQDMSKRSAKKPGERDASTPVVSCVLPSSKSKYFPDPHQPERREKVQPNLFLVMLNPFGLVHHVPP